MGNHFPTLKVKTIKNPICQEKRIKFPMIDPKEQKYNPFAVHIFGVLAPKSRSIVERSQWPGGY
jgi:hypothetical protein